MNTAELRVHIDAYLNLRGSLGFADGDHRILLAGTVELRGSTGVLLADPHTGDLGMDQCRFASLWSSWTENAPDPSALFSETSQSQRPRYRGAWTGPIAAPATPEAPFVFERGDHQAPVSHVSIMETRFAIAKDSLLDHWSARQHGAPRRRSDRSNGRRCSFRLRSSPTSYP